MKIFIVRFSVTHENCFHPDYKQGFEAFDLDGTWWAGHNHPGAIVVMEKRVVSFGDSATEAIDRFIKWQTTGLPESWLLAEYKDRASELQTTNGLTVPQVSPAPTQTRNRCR